MERDTLTHKRCPLCQEHKPTTEFSKNRARRGGLHTYCKSCQATQLVKWRQANPHHHIFLRKKNAAKSLGIEFSLDLNDVEFPTHCPVLGIELDYSYASKGGRNHPNSPSFDRIDPSKGYVNGNVIVVSQQANQIKSNATVDQLKKVAAFYEQLIPRVGGLNAANDNRLVEAAVA